MTMTVSDAVAEELQRAGVDRAFGLPGGEVLFLIDALREKGIEFTLCRHEADAGLAAAVYGKLKRVPGVVITTLGPGASNLMLAFSNSILDREPLLAISAQIPDTWPQTHTHQRIPLLECYRPVTKYAAAIDGYTARRNVRRALEYAMEQPSGPSYVTISPEDALLGAYEHDDGLSANLNARDGALPVGDASLAAQELSARLSSAERPLVLLGIGIDQRHAGRVRQWLAAWGLQVGVTPKVKGMVDETQENFVGVVGGMAIDTAILEALHAADLIVSLGLDPVEVDKTWHAELPITWALEAPMALNVVPRRNLICANHGDLLDCLIKTDPPREWGDPFKELKVLRREIYESGNPDDPDLSKNPLSVVRALAEVVPAETIVTTDVGAHKYLFGQFWPNRHPETFFMSNGLSGMGYGIPAALGAKLARPEVPVLAVVGDGGFSMNSQELETAERVGAPIIVIVLADKSYSLIRISQMNKGLPNYGVDFHPIDSVQAAQACGVHGVRAESGRELSSAVQEALSNDRSLVVEVPMEVSAYGPIV